MGKKTIAKIFYMVCFLGYLITEVIIIAFSLSDINMIILSLLALLLLLVSWILKKKTNGTEYEFKFSIYYLFFFVQASIPLAIKLFEFVFLK